MNNVMGVIAFIAGAAVGSFVTYKIVSKRYEEALEEKEWELEDAKEAFAKKAQKLEEDFENMKVFDPFADEETEEEYVDMIKENGYAEAPEKPSHIPYVIKPEDYGELEERGYDMVTFTLYEDGTIADDDMDVLTTVDETIGMKNLEYIGQYASDAVYVRNDALKYDAEVLKDPRTYAEAVAKTPKGRIIDNGFDDEE